MAISPKEQYLNYLAINLLERLGNLRPSQNQIDLMETLISQITINHQISFDDRLTEQEVNCLLLSAKGKNTKEIAAILKISSSSVKYYRGEILRKLRCKNIAAAVFEGIRYGYLSTKCSPPFGGEIFQND